jgi:leucyl/phenylalanyl-tRNA---protein transferase
MLPYLDPTSEFPNVNHALTDPNGLLAAGADLSTDRLLDAYTRGIFPWFSDDEPILWWSPNPRMVFDIEQYQPSKSLLRSIKKGHFSTTLNFNFAAVISECAAPRIDQAGTWITNEIMQAYCQLHSQGLAHSVEVWNEDNKLVGGIYGVAIGKLFCGESMFSRVTNGSKIALSTLIGYLKTHGFPLLDCQIKNDHLESLGAIEITREEYTKSIAKLTQELNHPELWQKKTLDPLNLVRRHRCDGQNSSFKKYAK